MIESSTAAAGGLGQDVPVTDDEPQGQNQINVPYELLVDGFQREIAALTSRAVVAEAQVFVLQQRNEFQRQALESREAPSQS